MATTREEVQRLLDSVPDDRLAQVQAVIEPFADPVALALANAPDDDEEFTDEDLAALAEARENYRRGETIPHEEVMREPGL